ncbi:MAG: hypothetical protein QM758_16830 [Armatimonas sp.]
MECCFAALGQIDDALSDRDYVRARSYAAEVISLGRELGMTKDWTIGLQACAYCALHLSSPEKAARLFGAAERIREETGEPRSAANQKIYEENVAEVRAAFACRAGSVDAFDVAWQEGRVMTREEAVDYALAMDEPES